MISAQAATVTAMGPTVSKLGASGKTPSAGTSPHVGLKPTTPQQAAGSRIEPALSVPRATSQRPAASAAPLPPLEPPGIRLASSGLTTAPKCGLSEVIPYANSCRFVLPTTPYPAASRAITELAVRSGTCSR